VGGYFLEAKTGMAMPCPYGRATRFFRGIIFEEKTMDTTLAVSEAGVNVAFHKALALVPPVSKADNTTWGPFFANYAVSVAVTGGVATLENAPANKLDGSNVNIAGFVSGTVGFDLGLVLPHLCFPPVKICGHVPIIGTVCLPQFCIPWPHVSIPLSLPFNFNLDLTFGFRVDDLGTQWGIDLLVDPFSPRFDLSPMASLIIDQMKNEVHSKLSGIPFIGDIIADLLGTVMDAFTPFVTILLEAFGGLINTVLSLLDLLNVSIPISLLKFDKLQTFIPANVPLSGDAPVKLTLTALTANVLSKELVAEGQLA
jgi:hypothetical protein